MKRQVHVKSEIRKAFEAKFVETLAKAKAHHGKDIPLIPFYFLSCGGKGGYYQHRPGGQDFIAINAAYFAKPECYEKQLNVTMPHEVAHYITRILYGYDRRAVPPHGRQWAQVMRWIGLPPVRCHDMDAEGIVNRHEHPYKYQCEPGCKVEHLFTARKHLGVQRMGKIYICRKCRSKLSYVGLVHNGHFTPAAKPSKENEIKTVRLAPRVIGIQFVPRAIVATTPPPMPKAPEPKPTHKVVTRFINGSLQNVRVPIEQGLDSGGICDMI